MDGGLVPVRVGRIIVCGSVAGAYRSPTALAELDPTPYHGNEFFIRLALDRLLRGQWQEPAHLEGFFTHRVLGLAERNWDTAHYTRAFDASARPLTKRGGAHGGLKREKLKGTTHDTNYSLFI